MSRHVLALRRTCDPRKPCGPWRGISRKESLRQSPPGYTEHSRDCRRYGHVLVGDRRIVDRAFTPSCDYSRQVLNCFKQLFAFLPAPMGRARFPVPSTAGSRMHFLNAALHLLGAKRPPVLIFALLLLRRRRLVLLFLRRFATVFLLVNDDTISWV